MLIPKSAHSSLNFGIHFGSVESELIKRETCKIVKPSRKIDPAVWTKEEDAKKESSKSGGSSSIAEEIESPIDDSDKLAVFNSHHDPALKLGAITESQNTGAVPDVQETFPEIIHYLDTQSAVDDDRLSQLSEESISNGSDKRRYSSYKSYPTNKRTSEILQDVLLEKRILCDLCEQLLQQIYLTKQKLFETESRQEISLQLLTQPTINQKINERSPQKHEVAVQTNDDYNYESVQEKLDKAVQQIKKDHEMELKLLKENNAKVQRDMGDKLQCLLIEIGKLQKQNNMDDSDKTGIGKLNHSILSFDDAETDNENVLSDREEVKNRMLHFSNEHWKMEQELATKNDEIQKLKQQIDQVAQEQSEMTAQFSSEFTKKVDYLQEENQSLKMELSEIRSKSN